MAAGGGKNPRRETPKKWDGPKDTRKEEGAHEYPNYSSWKTRSGHTIGLDDTPGKETLTIQHRGGSAVQMLEDGSVHIVANKGLYTIVMGEDRMTITGAQDITVKGDASLRVYGDLNQTVHGDRKSTRLNSSHTDISRMPSSA